MRNLSVTMVQLNARVFKKTLQERELLFAQYMCCSPSMEVQIEETGNRTEQCKVMILLDRSAGDMGMIRLIYEVDWRSWHTRVHTLDSVWSIT